MIIPGINARVNHKKATPFRVHLLLNFIYLIHCKAVESCIIWMYFVSLVVMKLATVYILQHLVGAAFSDRAEIA
jgi:hypothetical protein